MWIPILLIVLLSFCLFLLVQRFHLHNEIKKITGITKEIQTGNLNLRYRMRTSWKDMDNLGGELNRLLGYIQGTFERAKFLENYGTRT
jgi:nitrogen fixation/metabolism regulation signal transduction histidine kinase